MTNTEFTIEVDSTLLKLATDIFAQKGFSFIEALELFLDETICCGDVPLDYDVCKSEPQGNEPTVPSYCHDLDEYSSPCEDLADFDFDDIETDESETITIRITFDKNKYVWRSRSEMLPELMFESGSLDALIERCRLTLPKVLSSKDHISHKAQVMFSVEKLDSLTDIIGKDNSHSRSFEGFEWDDSFDDEEW
ncbi:hypothetical protein SAMN02910447_00425 [Ruminococcus sp. YE71]|uniref:DUF1902 domain-containing protein n=1 Tax=unclassified Ruminococcus TaxID=2608920 RepID=UPI00088D1230|nr:MULTISPECIES: DUF1902 domain-containing protein [unclassified Ruminococcus]SDA11504.1 hypothetical protein SAMN02910446_00424 [Ruminococcus sp. YE78]SFW15322.1 hypothetical protein SAMN02910447_00425 [Ruminococcus sp. YE71]